MWHQKAYIKHHVDNESDLRMCSIHLDGDRVISFHDDPVVTGELAGRNELGDVWYDVHVGANRRVDRPNPLSRARAAEPQYEELARLEEQIGILMARVGFLEKSNAGLTRAFKEAKTKAEAPPPPVQHCLPEGISVCHDLFPDEDSCVFFTSMTSSKLDLVLRMMEALSVDAVYCDMKRTSPDRIPFRDAFLLMVIRLRRFYDWILLARLCGRGETQIARTVHDLIVITSRAITRYLSGPLSEELENKFKVDGFLDPDFKNVRHIFDGRSMRGYGRRGKWRGWISLHMFHLTGIKVGVTQAKTPSTIKATYSDYGGYIKLPHTTTTITPPPPPDPPPRPSSQQRMPTVHKLRLTWARALSSRASHPSTEAVRLE
jgi:hypothetical protein